jgi:hypothetical protein
MSIKKVLLLMSSNALVVFIAVCGIQFAFGENGKDSNGSTCLPVKYSRGENFKGYGSGVPISSHEVLTAAHLVDNVKKIEVLVAKDKWMEARVKKADKKVDIALLITDDIKDFSKVKTALGLTIHTYNPKLYKGGFENNLKPNQGIRVDQDEYKDNANLNRVIAPTVCEGQSGGGIFLDNELIGIISKIEVMNGEKVLHIVTLDQIQEFLKKVK